VFVCISALARINVKLNLELDLKHSLTFELSLLVKSAKNMAVILLKTSQLTYQQDRKM
jgi:hypothetical protein